MKSNKEIEFRNAKDTKKCCRTCIFYAETDHRSGEGECEHTECPGDTYRGMLCNLWMRK